MKTLQATYAVRRDEIRARLAEFARVPRSEYFYELAYCLLTPQSSARNAGGAVRDLRRLRFRETGIDPTEILADRNHYIRFHATKAKRLLRLRGTFDGINRHLYNGSAGMQLRQWLVDNVNGLGWKEASHFLRNIGYRDLAILDRHVLKNLKSHGAIREIPAALTQKRYLATELIFHSFADRLDRNRCILRSHLDHGPEDGRVELAAEILRLDMLCDQLEIFIGVAGR